MVDEVDEVVVELFAGDADEEHLDRMAAALRRELLDIPEVDRVAPMSAGPAPAGTRAVDVAAIGAFLVTVKPTVELLGKVVGVVRAWLGSSRSRASTLRITVNGTTLELTPTQAQQDELVRAFLREAAQT
jgi:hypothetical protein